MLEVLVILLLVSSSCGLIGSVLVLRNQSMIADALSHSILLGIVLGFFISHSLDSPLLILGATVFGVLTVLGIDILHTQKISHDAATGLIFAFLFSIAVILISLFARNVHLDIDMVLMGEILFAPLHRTNLLGFSLPVSVVKSGLILLINVVFFTFCYQYLKLFLFDRVQAGLTGVCVKKMRLVILFLVSLTTVLSFDSLGSMTVIVFLVAPAMTAIVWAHNFWQLLLFSQLIGAINVSFGYLLASFFDLTMSGTCAVISLFVFCVNLLVRIFWKS